MELNCLCIIEWDQQLNNYRLSISGFTGNTPTDPFVTGHSNGQQFTTCDREIMINMVALTVQSMDMTVQHRYPVDGGIDTVLKSTMEDHMGLLD